MKNNKNNIKVVMFDLGNVMICFDHMISATEIAKYSNRAPEEIYNLFFYSPVTEKFDRGWLNKEEFFQEMERVLNLDSLNQEKFYNIWNNIFWENPGIAELVQRVKDRFQKFLIISNVNKPHFEYIRDKFPVVRLADEVILSYEVGVLKPDAKIYEVAIEKAKCQPQEIFYTDDREELIEAARALGFQAYFFDSIDSVRSYLLDDNE